MRIKQRKMIAFFTTWLTLVGLAVLTIFKAPDQWAEYGKWSIIGLGVNAIVFISFTVVKDYIISKHYKKELDDTIEK